MCKTSSRPDTTCRMYTAFITPSRANDMCTGFYCCPDKLHKLSGLKEHTFIISLFCGLGFQQGSHRMKIQVSPAAFPSGGSRGQSVSLPFPALREPTPHSLAQDPFLHLQH